MRDANLLQLSQVSHIQPHPTDAERALYDPGTNQCIVRFGPDEYRRISQRKTWLNDECINGLSSLIRHELLLRDDYQHHAERCAIFSTFHFTLILDGTPERLWRNTRRLLFWTKDIWVLPIHRKSAKHWVLAIIVPFAGEILLFDSFGDTAGWDEDLPVRWLKPWIHDTTDT